MMILLICLCCMVANWWRARKQQETTRSFVQEEGVNAVIVTEMWAGKGENVRKQFVEELGACKRDNHLCPKHEEVITESIHNERLCPVFAQKDGINEKSKNSDKMIQLDTNSQMTVQEGVKETVVGFGFEKWANKDWSPNDLIMQESGTRKKVLQEKGISRDKRYLKYAEIKAFVEEFFKKMELLPYPEKEELLEQKVIDEELVRQEERATEQERLVNEGQKIQKLKTLDNLDDTDIEDKDITPGKDRFKTYQKSMNSLNSAEEFFENLKDKSRYKSNIEPHNIDPLKEVNLNCSEIYGQTFSISQVYPSMEGNQDNPNEEESDTHEEEDEIEISLNREGEIRSLQQRLYYNLGLPRARTISLRGLSLLNGHMNPGQQQHLLSDSQQRHMNSGQQQQLLSDSQQRHMNSGQQQHLLSDSQQRHMNPGQQQQLLSDSQQRHMNPGQQQQLLSDSQQRHMNSGQQQHLLSDSQQRHMNQQRRMRPIDLQLARQFRNGPMVDIQQTRVSDICFQCGFSPARVWCTDCNNRFCVNCDAPFHGHPETRAHRRIWI